MNTKERFEKIRKQKKNPFSLRTRLTVLVTVEMLFCILVAYGLDSLIKHIIQPKWQIPLVLELLCVCLFVGILVTSLLSKLFFKPIKKLRKAMDQVAKGDLSVRLEERSSSREILELYTGFNLMTEELQGTDILKTDFVSNVSHEFKTPISAIEGYVTLLQDSEALTAQQSEYVDKILFNTNRLSGLVGSILLLSKLENQQITPRQMQYRLDEQIRQSIVAAEPAWGEKNIEFDAELDKVTYYGNEAMIRHIWDNLIGNAIKFSPEGGLIHVRLEQRCDQIQFTIDDAGPGIPEKAKKHIFDKFYQADDSHRQEGNGLGLSLVKQILTLEQGQIHTENLLPCGCRFTVVLNCKKE